MIGLGAGDMAMAGGSREGPSLEPRGRGVLVNRRLADELGLRPGDPLVLWLAAASGIPREFLAGRRDDPSRAVRCEVLQILPEGSPGSFSLDPDQRTARNVFVDRVEIARALLLAGKANAILLKTLEGGSGSGGPRASQLLQEALRREAAAEDLGLRILKRRAEDWIQVESEAFQIEPAVETAAREAAEAIGAPVASISAYLATSITLARPNVPRNLFCPS